MHIGLKLNWVLNGTRTSDVDPVLFRLLNAIQKGGSLRQGAVTSGLSYRHAWGLIKKWEQEFHSQIVKYERGRGKGATLTPFGEKLIWADHYATEQVNSRIVSVTEELNSSLAEYIQPGRHSPIVMQASHGMAVMYLYELMKEDPRFTIDFQVHGSLDSLQNLNSGHCQIAGFHLPLQLVAEVLTPRYIQWISPTRHLLLKLAVRQQGIIIRHGNPKNIRKLRDLTKRSIRFINRQRNSGTRTILDQLLIKDGIDSKKINGYANEEFTHVAVAAMIASGHADAGFGIRAAAEQFNLDFIPYLQEAYILALDKTLPSQLIKMIKNQLKSRRFRQKISHLAGYNVSDSGSQLAIQELLDENR